MNDVFGIGGKQCSGLHETNRMCGPPRMEIESTEVVENTNGALHCGFEDLIRFVWPSQAVPSQCKVCHRGPHQYRRCPFQLRVLGNDSRELSTGFLVATQVEERQSKVVVEQIRVG